MPNHIFDNLNQWFSDIFLLGIETGILYPHKSLVGQKRQFHLVVEARDEAGNGNNYDKAVIHVQVLNVNDNKPKFIMPAVDNATVEITEVRKLLIELISSTRLCPFGQMNY